MWRPNDRFSTDLSLDYTDREALLVHKGGGNYTSFESHQWSPRLETNYFISAKQQLRFTLQWTALKAFEDRFGRSIQILENFCKVLPIRIQHRMTSPSVGLHFRRDIAGKLRRFPTCSWSIRAGVICREVTFSHFKSCSNNRGTTESSIL